MPQMGVETNTLLPAFRSFHQGSIPIQPVLIFGPLSTPERTLILVSSVPPSVSHTLIFFSCSYVRKNCRQSEGTQARGADIFAGQNYEAR